MAKAWKIKGTRKNRSVLFNARRVIPVRLEELYSWDEAIRDPANDAALHGMRISAKRLRYSMELYTVCFGPTYRGLITTVTQVQKLLGEIQDCSVMVAFLQSYLKTAGPPRSARSALRDLMAARTAARDNLYRVFINFWDSLQKDDFKARLLAALRDDADDDR